MPRPAVLSGERVFLARLSKEDVREIYPYFSNVELTAYTGGWGSTYSLEDEQAWIEDAVRNRPDRVLFGIFERESGRVVGSTELRGINHHSGTATLGISLFDPAVWGRGYGTEATRLIVGYGMFHLNLFNVELKVWAFNERALGAYRRAGFREIGRRTGATALGGERFDDVWIEITRPEVDMGALRAQLSLLPPPVTP